ncbi:ABC transporter permease [candidate division KSB1 bacterium]|nr:ABC transporter permease [candidate division KSB1 bacterium]
MFSNYLKIAVRNLFKNKLNSLINILGLAVGMACTILLLLWVQDELSYDRFHENSDNIFRINCKWKFQAEPTATTAGLLAPAVKEMFPEVVKAGRMYLRPTMAFKYTPPDGNGQIKAFNEDRYYLIDNDILEMFSFPFVKGNPKTALQNGLVITESIAKKYFGDSDPIGKRFNVNNWFDATVTGVVKDVPANSHIQFDILGNLEPLRQFFPGGFTWGNTIHQTYVQIAPGANAGEVAQKFTSLQLVKNPFFAENVTALQLQPLHSIYLTPNVVGHTMLQGDIRHIYIFTSIAIIILLIACINFMNLTTAQSLKRASEIGVRKALGAFRKQLIGQFFGESLLLSGLALLGAILFLELALPSFNNFTGKSIALDYTNFQHLAFLLGMTLLTGLIAGSYPVLYLSKFDPIKTIKSAWSHTSSSNIRRSLVVAQFTISIVLLVATTVIFQQLYYMKNAKLGFNKENIICLPVKDDIGRQYNAFKNELLSNPHVLGITVKDCMPMESINNVTFWWEGKAANDDLPMEIAAIDHDFMSVMNVKFVDGRDFSRNIPTDLSGSLVVNEAAVRRMNMQNPVGALVKLDNTDYQIIGVIEDVNFKSMRYHIQPIIFHLTDKFDDDVANLFGSIFVKVDGNDISQTIQYISKLWDKFNPNYPLSYSFLDEAYDQLYHSEARIFRIFSMFTMLALFITCLGIFGLASFTAEQRTKEIGIRKVLGASISGILIMLSKDFTKWVLIANAIAWPIAIAVMNAWLQGYAYRIYISLWVLLGAGAAAILIALISVSWQAAKAAVANPVESLRYE